jgi:hypothetical protein
LVRGAVRRQIHGEVEHVKASVEAMYPRQHTNENR